MFLLCLSCVLFFFFKQKTAYEMRISDWSSDVCSSDLRAVVESVRHGDESWEIRVLSSYHRLARLEALTREERIERSAEWLECHRAFHLELVSACPSSWLLKRADRKSTRLNSSH